VKMILHILLKDLRRQWREIALYVLVSADWAWLSTHPGSWEWMRQKNMLPAVLFGLWVFIVIRAVQGECLVGDREFWATRPYRWWQLMSAKVLLCVAVLNLPLTVAELCLLRYAEIPLTAALIPGFLFLQLMFFMVATFLTSAIAAVTETLVQWLLTIAGMILFAIVLSWFPWDKLPPTLNGEENSAGLLGMAIVFGALLFLVVWQYARRGVWPARAALAVAVLTVPGMILLAHVAMVRAMAYPVATSPEVQLTVQTSADGTRTYTRKGPPFGNPEISIPVAAVHIDPHMVMSVEGMRLHLAGDHGWRWDSGWVNKSFWLGEGTSETDLDFSMPAAVMGQLPRVHATATVDLAYVTYRLTREQRIDTSRAKFEIPGVAQCRWSGSNRFEMAVPGLRCEAPLRLPGIVKEEMLARESTCSQAERDNVTPNHYAVAVQFGTDGIPADFDMDPVRELQMAFGSWLPLVPVGKEFMPARFCRGTPIVVQTGHMEERRQSSFTLGAIGTEWDAGAPDEGEE